MNPQFMPSNDFQSGRSRQLPQLDGEVCPSCGQEIPVEKLDLDFRATPKYRTGSPSAARNTGPSPSTHRSKGGGIRPEGPSSGGHLRNNTRKQKQLRWLYSMECVTGLVFF